MWEEFGFRQNPYDHLPVAANASGERLLVGRSEEVRKLMLRIRGRNAIPTLEGDIGVGKTSIIAVSAYKLEKNFYENGGPCYLALESPFQLESDDTADSFANRVYQRILVKLHESRNDLIAKGINVGETKKLYNWLTSEQYSSGSATIGTIGGGVGTAPNLTEGFSSLGFQNQVNLLLKRAFPSKKSGGVICVIDNLELLEKSKTAQRALEAMRDKVLSAHGIIWVICGARGIVRGVASSNRLQGYLSKPIDVKPLALDKLDGLIERRVDEYSIHLGEADPPVEQDGFVHIFKISNENLRTALKFCSDFSEWLLENDHKDITPAAKLELLEVWLAEEADDFAAAVKLTPKPLEIFEGIINQGGSISPSDHALFGYDKPEGMRQQIKTLEDAGLVDSTVDESDQRRRTISVTPKGWIVDYSRRGYTKG